MTTEKWKIRIAGYGTFDFEGTEQEAEDMRRHKVRWEAGAGVKWRTENQTEADKIAAEMAALWDQHKGVPRSLMNRLKRAENLARS